MHHSKICRLAYFEEGAGVLHELIEEDDILIVHIGKIHFILPLDMKESLQALISQRIAILRNDIPDKQYIVRVLAKEPNLEAKKET